MYVFSNLYRKLTQKLAINFDRCQLDEIKRSIEKFREVERSCSLSELSDGYHTFAELYEYRKIYNACMFNELYKAGKYGIHKSKRHFTKEECFGGGYFIVMAALPTGQVSNHYKLEDWNLFAIEEREFADEWDGHTPAVAAHRLTKFALSYGGSK